jgi:asparagine synthetase B (glutamine-hydrolysing)
LGLSKICRKARKEGHKVYLSGQGADEIIADYALFPYQSTFKGKFPEKLHLWENFYNGAQYSYLGKEECVAGSHGVETRYPFLDKEVVQEFLYLLPELKNRHYKAPIHEYLK